jgi:hypothetical protein
MTTIEQTSFLPAETDDHGIRRMPAEPRRKPQKEVSAPLVRDGQSLVRGSLASGARYEVRCLACDCWLTVDMRPPRYPVPICSDCAREKMSGGNPS